MSFDAPVMSIDPPTSIEPATVSNYNTLPDQLEALSKELAIAAKALAKSLDISQDAQGTLVASLRQPTVQMRRENAANRARQNAISIVGRMQTLLTGPTNFVERLANQNQLLACVQWLCEFQVLACIPLSGSVMFEGVADLVDVPVAQLRSVVRMTATAGFLRLHQPAGEDDQDQVAHTALSAAFVTDLSCLDAVMFLAETAAPAALHMTAATKNLQRSSATIDESKGSPPSLVPYNVAFNTEQSFQAVCAQQTKLQRQWPAYLRCITGLGESTMGGSGGDDSETVELLTRLNWTSLGSASVVYTGKASVSIATTLAALYPKLNIIVESGEPISPTTTASSSRITIQERSPGAPQTIRDAAVYILQLPSLSHWDTCIMPSSSSEQRQGSGSGKLLAQSSLPSCLQAELRGHLGVLRAKPSATLLVLARSCVLPESGSADLNVEAALRLHGLASLQLGLSNHDPRQPQPQPRWLHMAELVRLVEGVEDGAGRLAVVNKLQARTSAAVVVNVKYQSFTNGTGDTDSRFKTAQRRWKGDLE